MQAVLTTISSFHIYSSTFLSIFYWMKQCQAFFNTSEKLEMIVHVFSTRFSVFFLTKNKSRPFLGQAQYLCGEKYQHNADGKKILGKLQDSSIAQLTSMGSRGEYGSVALLLCILRVKFLFWLFSSAISPFMDSITACKKLKLFSGIIDFREGKKHSPRMRSFTNKT